MSNESLDYVLCYCDTITLKTPKSREKNEGRRYLDYCGIITTEYKWTTDGCGIVLKEPDKYPYITAVLNSPISRLFPVVCKSEMINSNYTAPTVMRRFPIVFPDNNLTEDLINTISSYLMFLNISTSPTGSENHLSPLRFQTFNRKVF